MAILRRVNQVHSLPDTRHAAAPPGPPAEEVAAAPEAARLPIAGMRALRAAYGENTLVVYTPWCRPSCHEAPDPVERAVLAACAAEKVRCFSIRNALVADQRAHHRIHRGFHNTGPGQGHLNRHGLAILGQVIWQHLEPVL